MKRLPFVKTSRAGTLTNPRTQVTNQHSFRIRTRGAKGPYCDGLVDCKTSCFTRRTFRRMVRDGSFGWLVGIFYFTSPE